MPSGRPFNSRNQMFQATDAVYKNLSRIAELIRQNSPHVVSLQEADQHSFWNGNFDHQKVLWKEAGIEKQEKTAVGIGM